MTGVLDTIERVTGQRPDTCPWHAFQDPLVVEVLDLYRMAASDDGVTPALLLPLDPPNEVWEGVSHYHEATLRLRVDARRRAQEKARGASRR